MANAMLLPPPDVPTFSGDYIEFASFIKAFNARIVPHTTSDTERLGYLDQYIVGEPKGVIKACTLMDGTEGYEKAMKELKEEYGNPYKVSRAYVDKLMKWKNIRNDDAVGLQKLARFLMECNVAMKSLSYMEVLNHIPNLQTVASKLPSYL